MLLDRKGILMRSRFAAMLITLLTALVLASSAAAKNRYGYKVDDQVAASADAGLTTPVLMFGTSLSTVNSKYKLKPKKC